MAVKLGTVPDTKLEVRGTPARAGGAPWKMLAPDVNAANRPGNGVATLTKDWLRASTPAGEEVSCAKIWPGRVTPDAKTFTRMATVEATPGAAPIWMDVSVAPPGVGGIAKLAELPLTVAVTTASEVTPPAVVEITAVGTKPGDVLLVINAVAGVMIAVTLAPPAGIVPVQGLRSIVPTGSVRP
jgi:hypothetical protein